MRAARSFHRRAVLLVLALFLPLAALTAQAAGEPPDAVLARLGGALDLLETPRFAASFTMTTRLELLTTKGELDRWVEQQDKYRVAPGAAPERTQVWRRGGKAGKDEADANSSSSASGASGGNSGGDGWKFIHPTGENRKYFAFGPVTREGTLLSASYKPAAMLQADAPKDRLTRGTLVWDGARMLPVKFTMAPLKMPPFTSELEFSYEFSESAGVTFPRAIRSAGEGGLLFVRRRFASTSTLSEFSPKP